MTRDRAVGRVGETPVAQTRLGAIGPGAGIADREKAVQHQPLDVLARQRRRLRPGHETRPAARQRHDVMIRLRAEARERALFQIATRRDQMIPLRTGHLPAFRREPGLQEDREGQIDIVAAEQNMVADRNPADVGDRARRAGSELEQTEIRGAAADIDDQDAPRLGRVPVHPFPQRLGRAVAFEPGIEGRLRLLQQPHAGGESGFLRGVQREALSGGVERGGHRNGDLLRIERRSRTGRSGCPRRPAERSGSTRRRGRARSFAPAEVPPIPRAESAPTGQPNDDTATTWPTARPCRAFPPPSGGRGGRQSIPRFPEPCQAIPRCARPPANRGTRAASSPRLARPGFPIAGRRAPRAAHRRSAERKRAPSSSCRDPRRWKTWRPSRRGRAARVRTGATACGPETQSSTSGPSSRASSRVPASRVP